jgi:hypothetical protein
MHPYGDPLAAGASAGLAARYALMAWMWVSHGLVFFFFCFSGDEHERGAVELATDPASPGTQASPTATVPPLHLQQTTVWYLALDL